jgi:hypothetical protein
MTASATTPFDGATGTDDEGGSASGKLFEMPAIEIDDSNPTAIHVVVAGSIPLDRSQKSDAAFYNSLTPGKLITLPVTFFVKGPKTVHRRDSDGNVDAVVQTKSLVVDGITHEDGEG